MKKMIVIVALALLGVLVLIQFVPVDRHNPPVALDIPTSPEVKAILQQSCYDCHSHETVWPWYSRIAPVSWLVAKDVHKGREELNFSTWDQYSTKERVKKLHESWEEVEEGEMPLWFYIAIHRDAKLSPENRAVMRAWSAGTLQRERDQDQKEHDDEKERSSR